MKSISVKLEDDVFTDMVKITSKLKLTKNRYINEAVSMYNLVNKKRFLKMQLRKESMMSAADSMEVLAELDSLMDES